MVPGSNNFAKIADLFHDSQGHVTANGVVLYNDDGNIVPDVILGPLFNNESASDQGVTLLHEALHVLLNRGDAEMATFLGLGTFNQTIPADRDRASAAISAYLRACEK